MGIALNIWRDTKGTGGGSAFNPTFLPNLLNWSDYSDVSTLFQTDDESTPVTTNGQTIGFVSDKSAANNDFSQAVALLRPIYTTGVQNGKSCAVFTLDFLQKALFALGGTTLSVFCVLRGDTPPDNSRFVSYTATGEALDFNNAPSGIPMFVTNTGAQLNSFRNNGVLSQGAITDGAFHQLGSIFDGTNSTLYINNVAQTAAANSDTFGATGTFTLGAQASGGDLTNMTLGELIITGSALNSAQRLQIATYFTNKWAV